MSWQNYGKAQARKRKAPRPTYFLRVMQPGSSFTQQQNNSEIYISIMPSHRDSQGIGSWRFATTKLKTSLHLLLLNTGRAHPMMFIQSQTSPPPGPCTSSSIHTVCKLTRRKRFVQHEGSGQYFLKSIWCMQNILPILANCLPFCPSEGIIFLTFANA